MLCGLLCWAVLFTVVPTNRWSRPILVKLPFQRSQRKFAFSLSYDGELGEGIDNALQLGYLFREVGYELTIPYVSDSGLNGLPSSPGDHSSSEAVSLEILMDIDSAAGTCYHVDLAPLKDVMKLGSRSVILYHPVNVEEEQDDILDSDVGSIELRKKLLPRLEADGICDCDGFIGSFVNGLQETLNHYLKFHRTPSFHIDKVVCFQTSKLLNLSRLLSGMSNYHTIVFTRWQGTECIDPESSLCSLEKKKKTHIVPFRPIPQICHQGEPTKSIVSTNYLSNYIKSLVTEVLLDQKVFVHHRIAGVHVQIEELAEKSRLDYDCCIKELKRILSVVLENKHQKILIPNKKINGMMHKNATMLLDSLITDLAKDYGLKEFKFDLTKNVVGPNDKQYLDPFVELSILADAQDLVLFGGGVNQRNLLTSALQKGITENIYSICSPSTNFVIRKHRVNLFVSNICEPDRKSL